MQILIDDILRAILHELETDVSFFWFNLLPHHALSAIMRTITRIQFRPFKNWGIRRFIRKYDVDMQVAQIQDVEQYPDFNAFFTRQLKPDARPIDAQTHHICSPVDGAVSAYGSISSTKIFQAKGHDYDLNQLIGNNAVDVKTFTDGHFITLYLSPRDYHRIHLPCDGQLQRMIYVPGRLFSVNQQNVAEVPQLFARNERLITVFKTEYGQMAVILVGAMFVGSMQTVWHGEVKSSGQICAWDYTQRGMNFKKGQELGHFNMGSTVIVLFENNVPLQWIPGMMEEKFYQMGQAMAMWDQTF